jgi:hypothetical protein
MDGYEVWTGDYSRNCPKWAEGGEDYYDNLPENTFYMPFANF